MPILICGDHLSSAMPSPSAPRAAATASSNNFLIELEPDLGGCARIAPRPTGFRRREYRDRGSLTRNPAPSPSKACMTFNRFSAAPVGMRRGGKVRYAYPRILERPILPLSW